jgi:hypothetical protein
MVTLLEINGAWWDIVFSDDDAARCGAGWYATRWATSTTWRTVDTYTTEHYATRRELLLAVRAVR